MTIQEAKKYLEESPDAVVIAPRGHEYTPIAFDSTSGWHDDDVFGEWRVRRELVVFEADVGHLAMSDCVVMYCESIRHLIGKRVKVSVEVIDEA